MLVTALHRSLEPYFGGIPTEIIEYNYVKSIGVGVDNYLSLEGVSPYVFLRMMNPNSTYPAFHFDELPEELRDKDLSKLLVYLTDEPDKFYLNPEFANKWLKAKGQFYTGTDLPEDESEKALISFCQDRIISVEELKTRQRACRFPGYPR